MNWKSNNWAFVIGLFIGSISNYFNGWYYLIIIVLIILFSVLIDMMYDKEIIDALHAKGENNG